MKTKDGAMLRLLFLTIFILATISASGGNGQASQTPRTVTLSIYVADILEIDSAHQTATIDFVVRTTWLDESLAFTGDATRYLDSEEHWTPQLQILGDLGMRKVMGGLIEVHPDGTVNERTRYVGKISSRMHLYDFPLDRQVIRIEAASASRQPVTLKPDRSDTGKADTFTVADWHIGDDTAYIATFQIMELEVPSIVFEIGATRHFGYYLWKVIVPLALIVFMSWAVFWIDPSAFAPQIGAATASMLTLLPTVLPLGIWSQKYRILRVWTFSSPVQP
jgi:hypothetical protein